MSGFYFFDIAALVVDAVVIGFYFKRFQIANMKDRCFCYLVFAVFFMTLFDFLSGLLGSLGCASPSLLWILNILYYIFNLTVAPSYAIYSFVISSFFSRKSLENKGNSVIMLFALVIPYLITLITTFLSPFFANMGRFDLTVFYINSNGEYVRGGFLFVALYVVTVYYCILSFMVVVTNRKKLQYGSSLVIIVSFLIFSLIGLAIQTIFQGVLIQCFCVSIAILVFSFSVKRPEDYMSSTTGLLNRKSVPIVLNSYFKKSRFFVIGIVVDDVSYLTSSFGIGQLENLLYTVSSELKAMFVHEKVFSLAPGRFLICFKDFNDEKVKKSCEKIINRFSKGWLIETEQKISLKLYVRICCIQCPDDASDTEEIIDAINFFAEGCDLNKEVVYLKDIDWNIRTRTKNIEYELNKGVVDNKFQVFYQPIYSVKEGMFIGAEALCRLQDEDGNFISPEEFIPIAEKNGTIFKIGQRVLESVCKMLDTIKNPQDFGIKKIHINLSVCQCMQDIMTDMILSTLSTYGIEPSILSLEVTENTFAYMPEIFARNISRLNAAGVEVVMDDYGIGYSNLNYLLEVPFKMVKIDRGIIWDSEKNRNKEIALSSTISMIKTFNMPVLAEGIETKEQAKKLKQFGCDYLQGFFFGKPIPENEFLDLMSLRHKKFDF